MNLTPDRFEPMLSSVIASQDAEVTLGKQPVLAEYGREVRAAVSALPPEVSRGLLSEYREPSPQVVASVEAAIMSREMAIENASQEVSLDREWAAGEGTGRHIDEKNVGAKDAWLETPEP